MKKANVAAAGLVLLVVGAVVSSQNKPSTSTINLTSTAGNTPAGPTAEALQSASGPGGSSSTEVQSAASGQVVAAAKSAAGSATREATTKVAAPIHIALPSDNVTTTTVPAGSSRQPQSTGTVSKATEGGAIPVAQPSAALDADASAQFGVRYAGLSYDLSTPRLATIHVKVGGPIPSTYEGVGVVSAQYSLQELQQYLDHLDSLQTAVVAKVPMVAYGLDIANNAVMVNVSTLSDTVQADFTGLVGSGPYVLHLQLGQNVLGTGPPGSVPKP